MHMPARSRRDCRNAIIKMAEELFRIAAIELDEHSVVRRTRQIEQEREIAIYDLLEANYFAPDGMVPGPYHLTLSLSENRLVLSIRLASEDPGELKVMLSLTPFRHLIKDYFLVCESYYKAIRNAPPSQIEALDMGRRGLHDEGSTLLKERLEGKIAIDFDTARRLFTLICVLHLRG
jgi:uncharacterized protein (UPF0262 family)